MIDEIDKYKEILINEIKEYIYDDEEITPIIKAWNERYDR
jgi:hypothetical protein